MLNKLNNSYTHLKSIALPAVWVIVLYSQTWAAHANSHIPTPWTNENDIVNFLLKLMNLMFSVFLVTSVILVIYTSFMYMFASGEPEKLKKARSSLIWTIVAIAIAILARSIPAVVGALLNTPISV